MLKSLFLSFVFFTNVSANEFTLKSLPKIELQNIKEIDFLEEKSIDQQENLVSPLGEIIESIDGLIAIGKSIWPIIDAGRPIITNTTSTAVSIIPNIEGPNVNLNQMSNWSKPISKSYRVTYKVTGIKEAITFTFSIIFQYNGSYKGKGKYIANLKLAPKEINTFWSFDFYVSSSLIGISNIGTDQDPVAGATIEITYGIRGKVNENRNFMHFFVDGNGNVDRF